MRHWNTPAQVGEKVDDVRTALGVVATTLARGIKKCQLQNTELARQLNCLAQRQPPPPLPEFSTAGTASPAPPGANSDSGAHTVGEKMDDVKTELQVIAQTLALGVKKCQEQNTALLQRVIELWR